MFTIPELVANVRSLLSKPKKKYPKGAMKIKTNNEIRSLFLLQLAAKLSDKINKTVEHVMRKME